MKPLVQHLWWQNKKEIVAKSLLHCHAHGVHSIMLQDIPCNRIRLFVATPDHTLWKNDGAFDEMSVGYHAHHCDLTLLCFYGTITNILAKPIRCGTQFRKFVYESKISSGRIGFRPIGMARVRILKSVRLLSGVGYSQKASDVHTVFVNARQMSAWFVLEGKEDRNYKPFCWSNAPLHKQSFDKLYKKPTQRQVKVLLEMVNLL